MFIELSEFLRCPGDHDTTYLVVATGIMDGRDIVHGTIGCPVCEREFLIDGSVAYFGAPDDRAAVHDPVHDPDDLAAVLALGSPGGFVLLVGSASRFARALSSRIAGVHFATINAPSDVGAAPCLSLVRAQHVVPLKDHVVRGAVLGEEYADLQWLDEGARVLLRGQRLVVLREGIDAEPETADLLAVGRGMWVGRSR